MSKTIGSASYSLGLRDCNDGAFRVGRIVAINPEGRPLVDFPGNLLGPLEARYICLIGGGVVDRISPDSPVLLAFNEGDHTLPIIVGGLRDTCDPDAGAPASLLPSRLLREVIVDGKMMVFDAKEEIALRCGKSSIILRKDGKVIIKGADIVTRASRTNKIKGGAVMIN